MVNSVKQAEKLTLSASQVFDKAVSDIEKANGILEQSIAQDKAAVKELNAQVTVIVEDVKSKQMMLSENRSKLKNLSQFTTGK